jgi:hypothetical protein
MAVHSKEPIVATGQVAGPKTSVRGSNCLLSAHDTQPHIRIWRYDTLETVRVIGEKQIERAVAFLAFSTLQPEFLVCP